MRTLLRLLELGDVVLDVFQDVVWLVNAELDNNVFEKRLDVVITQVLLEVCLQIACVLSRTRRHRKEKGNDCKRESVTVCDCV